MENFKKSQIVPFAVRRTTISGCPTTARPPPTATDCRCLLSLATGAAAGKAAFSPAEKREKVAASADRRPPSSGIRAGRRA